MAAQEQLLDVIQDVELPLLHLRLQHVDDVLRGAEAGPELEEDFADSLCVVRHAERRPEDLLDEVQVLGRDRASRQLAVVGELMS